MRSYPVSPFTGDDPQLLVCRTTKNTKVGTNLVWTPVKGFDIGAEFAYIRGISGRPVGLAAGYCL